MSKDQPTTFLVNRSKTTARYEYVVPVSTVIWILVGVFLGICFGSQALVDLIDFSYGYRWNYLERCIYVSEAGLFPKAVREAIETWVLQMLVTPGGAQYWEHYGATHGTDVQEVINHRLADRDNLPPPMTETFPFFSLSEKD